MKKSKLLRSLIALVLALAAVCAISAIAAEYAAGDGMTFEIVTSKAEYGVNEEIQIILLAKNYNQNMKLANISWTAQVPMDELTLMSGDIEGAQVVEVGERAAINLRMMKVVNPPEEETPPATEPAPTEPVDTDVEEQGPSAGTVVVLIVLIVLALAGIGGIVFLILKRRGIISCIALVLALGMLLPCIPAVDVSAVELNSGEIVVGEGNTMNASVKFIVDGKEYEATATITYEMADQTETVVEAMHSSMSVLDWVEYKYPTISPTIGEHPRLMFTKDDIPGIIKAMESEECAELVSAFYRYLGITFNGSFGTPKETVDENGNVVIERNYSADKLYSIRAKALYYALFKDSDNEKDAHMAGYYGKQAVRAIQNALESVTFAPNDYDIYYRGDCQLAAAEVYDWCYDLLTHEDKQNIAAGAIRVGAPSEAGWPIKIGESKDTVVSHIGGNLIQQYWLAIAIAMYDEYPTFYEYVGGAYFDLYLAPRNIWYVSETHHQGISYGVGGRGDADLNAQYLIYAMTGGDNDRDGDGKDDGFISLDPIVEKSADQVLYSLRPDGQFLREGDTWEENQTDRTELWDANANTFARRANFYKNGVYRRLALELKNLKFTGTDAFYLLVTHDTEVDTESYYNMPYTKYFGTPSGSMIARTGWDMGTDSNDVIAKMQLSQVYVNNHQHHDAGNFQIYYKGILASESGYYVLYNTPHDLNYTKSSIAHNTLSITSVQNRYGVQNNSEVRGWGTPGYMEIVNTVVGHEYGPNTYKPEYSYLAGDIAKSYDANVQEAVRSMLFLNLELDGNTEHPGAFVVFDQIKTTQVGSKKSFLLHMQQEPTVDDNVITIKNTRHGYNGQLTNQVLYMGTAAKADADYTISVIGGDGKQFLVGQYNYAHNDTIASTLSQEQGWGRVEITTKTTEENQTDYMLNVMYVSDGDSDAQLVPAKLIYDGQGVLMGAQLMNHVAMFNMDGNNRIAETTTFTIPANEGYNTFKVNVAGLKAGTWTVYVNGKSIGNQIASEDGGMIYFEAAAGTVKLVYTDANSNKTFDETPNTDEEPIGIMVNNFYYYTDAHPVQSGDDYLIPASLVFDALNGKGSWSRDGSKYSVLYKGVTYELTATSITKNGEAVAFKEIRAEAGDLLVDMATMQALVGESGKMYYDRFINRIRINVEAQVGIPELSKDVLYEYPTAVQVEAIIDNGYSTMPLSNCLDGDVTTRWTSQKSGNNICEAIFDFGKVVPLTDMLVMFFTEETLYSDYIFDLYVSLDGVTWEEVYKNTRSGEIAYKTTANTYISFPMNNDARFVKIVGQGRYRYTNAGKPNASVDNGWTIIKEILFLQKSVIDPDGAEIIGNKLLAEAECFHMQDTAVAEGNTQASGKESVTMKVGYTTNPGTVTAAKPQLWATFIPNKTATYYIWAKVNTSKVTSGDCLWVNIEGVTGDTYYAEKVNVGKKDKDGFEWIKLGQYEDQLVGAIWNANEEYDLSVISGCDGLIIDCFVISPEASYVPYEDCYSKQTNISGEVSVNAKDAIYEYSMAKPSGTAAKLQSVSADGSVSQAYIDYVLNTKNMPGDITLNIITDTSGTFSVWATLKAASAAADRFFYAVSANNEDFEYTLDDLSEMETESENGYLKVKLGEIEIQASESIYVRIKTCDKGMTVGKIFTTCRPITGVHLMTGGSVTVQAEDAKLQGPGVEEIIPDQFNPNQYYEGDISKIVERESAAGGKAVEFLKTYTNWYNLMRVTSEASSHLSFRVMPDESGEYYIWAKVYAQKETGLYAWIEGGDDYYYWRQPLTLETYSADADNYIWVRLYQECQNGVKLTREHLYEWTARRVYTINLRGMYAGVQVDEIFITNDPGEAPHNHKYAETWSHDNTHHWYQPVCGCTDAPLRFYGEHYFEDHTDNECNTCGCKNPNYAPHNYVDGKCTICGGLPPFATSGGKLTLEAEDLMLAPDDKENHIPNQHNKPVVKVVEQTNASSGKAVQIINTNSGWNTFLEAGTTPIPHISALVTPDKSGQYYIWLRVYSPANLTYGAKIYAYIDGGTDTHYWRQPLDLNGISKGAGDYYWVCLNQEWRSDTVKQADHAYNWTAGQTYKIRLRGAVANVQVDQIYITNSASDIPHSHEWNSLKSFDENHHWWTSSCHDGLVTEKEAHTYNDLLDTTCNDCGYVRPPHEHTYSDLWSFDAYSHWHECACGHKKDTAEHTFVDGVCSACGMRTAYNMTGGKLTIEAEEGAIAPIGQENFLNTYYVNTNHYNKIVTTHPMGVKTNSAASGGLTMQTKWTFNLTYAMMNQGNRPNAHLVYAAQSDTTSEVYIWLKVSTSERNSVNYQDGIFCMIEDDNGTDTYYWRQPLAKADGTYSVAEDDFYWVRLKQAYHMQTLGNKEGAYGAEKVYNWTAGKSYVLRFRSVTENVEIDQIYITNDPNDIPHVHTYSTEWESDENDHWHKADCGHDELFRDKNAHTFENVLDRTCDVCGYERPAHVCTPDEAWHSNTTHHWHECICGAKPGYEEHRFEDGICTVCSTLKDLETPTGVSIVEDYDGYVGADWIAKLGLPTKVKVAGVEVDVQWEDVAAYVNPDVVGSYAVPGTVKGVQKAVYFKVEVRAYSNLLENYNGSLENKPNYWSLRNQGFTTEHVYHGKYATKQIMPSGWTTVSGQPAYSYNKYSEMFANTVTQAGEYWFGVWAMIGANTVTGEVNDNFTINMAMHRTTTLVPGLDQLGENNNSVAYESSRKLTTADVTLNADGFTRVGMVANMDGLDEHLRFYVNTGKGVANDILYLDNIELVPLKLPLAE